MLALLIALERHAFVKQPTAAHFHIAKTLNVPSKQTGMLPPQRQKDSIFHPLNALMVPSASVGMMGAMIVAGMALTAAAPVAR